MKKIFALILALFMLFGCITTANSNEGSPTTPTDLTPTIQPVDYVVTLANLSQYSIVALRDAYLNGHTRGSIWIGGTLTSGANKFVDDGSIGGVAASDSYVAINKSSVQFKGRTSEQGLYSYYGLTESAINSTRTYWRNLISGAGTSDMWIYVKPDNNGHVDLKYWDYQCEGSDESKMSIGKVYWTDATSVTMGGLAGHLIAPYADVTIVSCNHRGSVVGKTVKTSGEAHINYLTPPEPPTKTITVTKVLKGEIWQVRCDVMDNTDFKAGGGYWKADITNSQNATSKEGHRSNHCGNKENWVLFVNEEGQAVSLYQLKSGSTGGTLPSIMYRAPTDLAAIGESQLIYDPTDPNDEMTNRLKSVFSPENVMPFSEINLQEGQRLFWISQNGKQVWHHTGVLHRTDPKFAISINGVIYNLGVGDTITLTDIEEGLLEIEEIATANYKLQAIEYDEDGHVTIYIKDKINLKNDADKAKAIFNKYSDSKFQLLRKMARTVIIVISIKTSQGYTYIENIELNKLRELLPKTMEVDNYIDEVEVTREDELLHLIGLNLSKKFFQVSNSLSISSLTPYSRPL